MAAPRIVCLGGGTGLAVVLRGLKVAGVEPMAIVTLTDDGGSSGRLRREMDMPPPGDIRNCLVALAEDESLLATVFQHRFSRGDLAGHSLGNLFLAALTEVVGSFEAAVALSSRVLAIAGEVMPATPEQAALVAEMEDGRVVAGETAVANDRSHVRRLRLEPARPLAHPAAVTRRARGRPARARPGLAVHVDAAAAAGAAAPRRRPEQPGAARLHREPAPADQRDDRLRRRAAHRPPDPARRRGHRRHRRDPEPPAASRPRA